MKVWGKGLGVPFQNDDTIMPSITEAMVSFILKVFLATLAPDLRTRRSSNVLWYQQKLQHFGLVKASIYHPPNSKQFLSPKCCNVLLTPLYSIPTPVVESKVTEVSVIQLLRLKLYLSNY